MILGPRRSRSIEWSVSESGNGPADHGFGRTMRASRAGPMPDERKSVPVLIRLGVIVLPILAGGLLWAFHRNDLSLISRFRHPPATSPAMPTDARPTDAAATTPASASA